MTRHLLRPFLGLLICAALLAQAYAQETKVIPNRGYTLPRIREYLAIAFGKQIRFDPTIDPSIFTQVYRDKEFSGSLNDILQTVVSKSEIKVRCRQEGEAYVVELSEPLVYLGEVDRKPLREVIKTIFDAWKVPYRLEVEGDPEAPSFRWRTSRSVSVALASVLSMCSPQLDDNVIDGVHVISPRTDVGIPIVLPRSGHLGNVIKCEYSLDSARAATMGEDGYINVWDVILGSLAGPTRPGVLAEHGLMTENNQLLFADGSGVYLNTIGRGDRIQIIRNIAQVTALAYAPEARLLAVGDAKGRLVLWNIDEAKRKATKAMTVIDGEGGYIHFLTISLDGRNLAFVTGRKDDPDGQVIWTQAPFDQKLRARAKPAGSRKIIQIGLNPQGDVLACCTEDGQLTYWSPGDYRGRFVKASLTYQEARVRFAFTPDGDALAYSFENQAIRTQDVRTGRGTDIAYKNEIATKNGRTVANGGFDWNVTAMAYSPDGKAILLGTDAPDRANTKVFGYDPTKKRVKQSFDREANSVSRVAFSGDGNLLLVQDVNGLHIWHPSMEALPESVRANALSLQPRLGKGDTSYLAVGGDPIDDSLTYWDADTGTKLELTTSHRVGRLDRIVWSGNGQSFLTHDFAGELVLWPVQRTSDDRLEPVWVLPGSYSRLAGFALNSDGTRVCLAGSGPQGFFRVLEAKTGRVLYELKNDPVKKDHPEIDGPVVSAADGDIVAFRDGRSIVLIRPSDGQLIRRFDGKAVALSGDGRFAAIEDENAVRTFDLQTFAQVYQQDATHFPQFSSDSTRLIGFNQNKSVVAIKPAGGPEFKIGPLPSAITSVDVMPGTGIIAIGRADGFVSLYDSKHTFLANLQAVGRNDYIAFSDRHYYMGSPDAATKLRITGPNGEQCTWDQWDLLLNRPDQVMRRIGLAPETAIKKAELAYRKRLTQLGFDVSRFEKLASDVESLRLPTVQIENVKVEGNAVTFRARAKSREANIESILVTINGVPIDAKNTASAQSKQAEAEFGPVELSASGDQGFNTLRVSAVDAMGMEGRESKTIPVALATRKPDLYVIAVGVKDYADPNLPKLLYPEADAMAVVNVFSELAKPQVRKTTVMSGRKNRRSKRTMTTLTKTIAEATFASVHPKIFLSKDATRENLLCIREYLAQNTKIGDMVVLFFSGHGDAPKDTYYFLTPDATPANMEKRALSLADIDHLFDGVPARQRLVLLDTCHAGESELGGAVRKVGTSGRGAKGLNITTASSEFELMQELFANLEVGSGASIISASTGGGVALEANAYQHGAFTKALIEGVREQQATDEEGRITVASLKDYVLDRVQTLTKNTQKPTMRRQNASFDFVLRAATN